MKKTSFKIISRQEKRFLPLYVLTIHSGFKKLNKILFYVPIGSAEKTDLINFHQNYSAIKFVEHDKNTCLFSSLVSNLYDAREILKKSY